METKDNRNISASQIKRLAASKVDPSKYDTNARPKVPHKQKTSSGVSFSRKKQANKNPKHKAFQTDCVMCKKSEMPERKYLAYMKNCFGCRSD